MKITRAVVPSLFTVLNIFCGFSSLLHTAAGDYGLATSFVFLAGMFDVLDGVMARITKSSSNFGVQFDSLSDVVSFGAAPAFLVYRIYLHSLDGVGILLSSMPLIFGALRLARFNAQVVGYDKDFFKGLPIPASAIILCAYVRASGAGTDGLNSQEASVLVPLVVTVSFLMVSTVKYDTLPKFSRRGIKQHPVRFMFVVAATTWILATKGDALFPVFMIYLATGPLRYVVQFIKHGLHPAAKEDEKESEAGGVDI